MSSGSTSACWARRFGSGDPGLAIRGRVGDHAAARHLGAGARGGGDGDERHRRLRVLDVPGREAEVRPALRCHEPGGLGRVHGRAAADRDDRVGRGRLERGARPLLDVVDGRLARALDEALVASERVERRGHLRQVLDDLVDNDERARPIPRSRAISAEIGDDPSPNRIRTGRWLRNGSMPVLILARTSSPARSPSRPGRRAVARYARSSGSGRRPGRRTPPGPSHRARAPRSPRRATGEIARRPTRRRCPRAPPVGSAPARCRAARPRSAPRRRGTGCSRRRGCASRCGGSRRGRRSGSRTVRLSCPQASVVGAQLPAA